LNEALFDLARYLQAEGYRVMPVPYKEMPGWNLENRPPAAMKLLRRALALPKVQKKVESRMADRISYRHAAVEAGLGELGVHNLLLTPEHGARVRMVALVTDASLEPGKPMEPALCQREKCGFACVKACPAGALQKDGSPTRKSACLETYLSLGIPGMSGVRCGLCVAKCPAHQTSGAGRP
jgi:epoxyqueuosine reductase QueG